MKIDVRIDTSLRFTVSGQVNLSELVLRSREAMNLEKYHPGMPAVMDLRLADMGSVDREAVDKTAKLEEPEKALRGEGRMAFVVRDGLSHGIKRMFIATSGLEYVDYQIFTSPEQADEWLAS